MRRQRSWHVPNARPRWTTTLHAPEPEPDMRAPQQEGGSLWSARAAQAEHRKGKASQGAEQRPNLKEHVHARAAAALFFSKARTGRQTTRRSERRERKPAGAHASTFPHTAGRQRHPIGGLRPLPLRPTIITDSPHSRAWPVDLCGGCRRSASHAPPTCAAAWDKETPAVG